MCDHKWHLTMYSSCHWSNTTGPEDRRLILPNLNTLAKVHVIYIFYANYCWVPTVYRLTVYLRELRSDLFYFFYAMSRNGSHGDNHGTGEDTLWGSLYVCPVHSNIFLLINMPKRNSRFYYCLFEAKGTPKDKTYESFFP